MNIKFLKMQNLTKFNFPPYLSEKIKILGIGNLRDPDAVFYCKLGLAAIQTTSHDSRNDNDGIPLMLADPDLFHIFLTGGDRDDQRFWMILADGIGVHRECSASIPEENRRCLKAARSIFAESGI